MTFFATTLESMAISAAVGGVGFWAARRGRLDRPALKVLSLIALDIALPCQIFASILRAFEPAHYPGWWQLPLWWGALTLLQGAIALLTGRLFDPSTRREAQLGLLYQNAIFIPLVMLVELFGPHSRMVVQLFLFTLFFPAFFFTTAPLFYPAPNRGLRWNRLLTPSFIATGAALALKGLHLGAAIPEFALRGLELVGAIAVPGLLMYLGGAICHDRSHVSAGSLRPILGFVAIRNLLIPMLVLGIVHFLPLPGELSLLLVLQAAMPPITALTALVDREGGDRLFTNRIMLASFLVALITVPLFLSLHHRFIQPVVLSNP